MQSEKTNHKPLRIPPEIQTQLNCWVSAGYPEEVCGLLVGRTTGEGIEVVRVVQARNIETRRKQDRFVLAPDDWLAAENRAREEGLEIIGIWHSHPDHPARPSQTDLEAAWEGYAYLIVSVTARGIVDVRPWQLVESSFEEQTIEERT